MALPNPKTMVQARMTAKLANIHTNKGMKSPYPSGIASTNRKSTTKANLHSKSGGVSAKLAGTKPGQGQPQQPKVPRVKATLSNKAKPSVVIAKSSFKGSAN